MSRHEILAEYSCIGLSAFGTDGFLAKATYLIEIKIDNHANKLPRYPSSGTEAEKVQVRCRNL